MKLSADTSWFTISLNGNTDFLVYAFSGYEAVSKPYEIRVELVHWSALEPLGEYLGKEACLTIADRSGVSRPIHGLVAHMEQLHRANARTHYACTIVPRLWFLQETCNHRIFQEKSVTEIISEVLEGQGFGGESFSLKCFASYKPRTYCVQYGESDFHFISRLCEEEGIYYFHEHTADGHCLTFCDMPGGPPISGEALVRYFQGSGQEASEPVISRLSYNAGVRSTNATYREWNFEKPRLDLQVLGFGQKEPAMDPPGLVLETYRYPHLYQLRQRGQAYADVEVMRQQCHTIWIAGESDVCRLVPSHTFSLTGHARHDCNRQWFLLTVSHEGRQPGVLGHEAPDDRGLHYNASFTAIPSDVRYVPPSLHHKKRIGNKQTAIVTGPEGEEIYPDKYGRVKVQFFWDRLEQWNEKTTCWIRVSQGWAGSGYGMEALPRIGHEVIVSFLEGDPDRPIITGRVYHANNMPFYALPEHKTRTVFKSMSTPGEAQEERGYNELRIEDKKGEEEIFSHAEKDVNTHVKHDWKESILRDYHETVENYRYTLIPAEQQETQQEGGGQRGSGGAGRVTSSNGESAFAEGSGGNNGDGGDDGDAKNDNAPQQVHHIGVGPRMSEIMETDNTTIHGDFHVHYKTRWLAKASDEIHLESLIRGVIEAGADVTLKVGPSFIHITPGGIEVVGPNIDINSGGSAGDGTGAHPLLPEGAIPPLIPPAPHRGCLIFADSRQSAFCVQDG